MNPGMEQETRDEQRTFHGISTAWKITPGTRYTRTRSFGLFPVPTRQSLYQHTVREFGASALIGMFFDINLYAKSDVGNPYGVESCERIQKGGNPGHTACETTRETGQEGSTS